MHGRVLVSPHSLSPWWCRQPAHCRCTMHRNYLHTFSWASSFHFIGLRYDLGVYSGSIHTGWFSTALDSCCTEMKRIEQEEDSSEAGLLVGLHTQSTRMLHAQWFAVSFQQTTSLEPVVVKLMSIWALGWLSIDHVWAGCNYSYSVEKNLILNYSLK